MVRNRHNPAETTMDHGNRSSPVSLTRNTPIFDFVRRCSIAKTFLLGQGCIFLLSFLLGEPGYGPLLKTIPYSSSATEPSCLWITGRMGMPYLFANSWSLKSCAGTAIMAPV